MRERAADPTGLDESVQDPVSSGGKFPSWRLGIEVAALMAAVGAVFSSHSASVPLLIGSAAVLAGAVARWLGVFSTPNEGAGRWRPLAAYGLFAAGTLLWAVAGVEPAVVFLVYAGTVLLGSDGDQNRSLAALHIAAVGALIASAALVGTIEAAARDIALGVFVMCAVGGQLLHTHRLRQALLDSREELESLVNMDRLTGLNNRQAFDAYVERVWRQSRRCAEKLSIVIVDVDFFAEFTERYGLPEGDRCIQRVGGVLSSVGKRPLDYVARFGHSSFALILYDPQTSYIRRLVSELQSSVAALHIPNERSPIGPRLTISIGAVVLGPESEKTLEATIEFAEKAVAGAKMRGGDRAVICESSDLRRSGEESRAVADRMTG